MESKQPWNICRVCFQEGQMHSLFSKKSAGMTIAEKLNMFAGIKVMPDEKLPEQICHDCMIRLNSSFEFQFRCKKAEFLLQMAVKHQEQLDRGEEQSALMLTLNNGKVYTMPKDVTVRRKSAFLSTISKPCIETNSEELGSEKSSLELTSADSAFSEMTELEIEDIMRNECPSSFAELFETISDISTFEETEFESSLINEPTLYDVDENNLFKAKVRASPKPRRKREKQTGNHINRSIKLKKLKAPNNPKCFVCELCGNQYKTKIGLDLHLRIHKNERPYKCEICSASFVQSSDLTMHMRRHTGDRPYQCKFCSRRFVKKEAKDIHERTHTGEKPYECNICHKKFSYTSVLNRHKILHTEEEKNFECVPCGKRFRFKYHLVAHLRTSSHQKPLKTK